jgi:hypothetical protein
MAETISHGMQGRRIEMQFPYVRSPGAVHNADTAMTYDDFRDQLNTWWAETDAREIAGKSSQGASLDLIAHYQRLDEQDRRFADRVLSEWIESTNERKRFDALAMVDHFRIRSASAPLRLLASETAMRTYHEAPYEVAKVRRILDRLEE